MLQKKKLMSHVFSWTSMMKAVADCLFERESRINITEQGGKQPRNVLPFSSYIVLPTYCIGTMNMEKKEKKGSKNAENKNALENYSVCHNTWYKRQGVLS